MKVLIGVFLLSWIGSIGFSAMALAAGTGTNQSTSTGTFAVPCIGDDGKPKNADANTCAAILPLCSDLRTSYLKDIKRMLSLKIAGYYQGVDADLSKSTVDEKGKVNLQGSKLNYPVCSVVGHKLKYTETAPITEAFPSLLDASAACERDRTKLTRAFENHKIELKHQNIGPNPQECGKRPGTDQGGGTLALQFSGANGTLWNAYILGSYQWLIRKNAAEVLNALDPNLSNIADLLKSDSPVKDQVVKLTGDSAAFYSDMSKESKSVCKDPNQKDVIKKCLNASYSVTDPANRLCTLVKAQASISGASVSNALLLEIMARVKKDYDDNFGNLLSFANSNFNDYLARCGNDSSRAVGGSNRKKKAARASCIFDGANFYTYNSRATSENDCSGRSSRQASYAAQVHIDDGHPRGYSGRVDPSNSLNLGFAGYVESRIRKLCGQSKYTDDSPCDSIDIPDAPVTVAQ